MKKKLALTFAIIGWLTIALQYFLMVENRVTPITETTIRFFSFFTILTNTLVAIYFTCLVLLDQKKDYPVFRPGFLTAITVFISVVGLVFQVALRTSWQPWNLQFWVNDILHSVIPMCVIYFWYRYEDVATVAYQRIFVWMIYPLVYLFYILIRGSFSGFYPYPFVDVNTIGMGNVLINSLIVTAVFFGLSFLFLWIGKTFLTKRRLADG